MSSGPATQGSKLSSKSLFKILNFHFLSSIIFPCQPFHKLHFVTAVSPFSLCSDALAPPCSLFIIVKIVCKPYFLWILWFLMNQQWLAQDIPVNYRTHQHNANTLTAAKSLVQNADGCPFQNKIAVTWKAKVWHLRICMAIILLLIRTRVLSSGSVWCSCYIFAL